MQRHGATPHPHGGGGGASHPQCGPLHSQNGPLHPHYPAGHPLPLPPGVRHGRVGLPLPALAGRRRRALALGREEGEPAARQGPVRPPAGGGGAGAPRPSPPKHRQVQGLPARGGRRARAAHGARRARPGRPGGGARRRRGRCLPRPQGGGRGGGGGCRPELPAPGQVSPHSLTPPPGSSCTATSRQPTSW